MLLSYMNLPFHALSHPLFLGQQECYVPGRHSGLQRGEVMEGEPSASPVATTNLSSKRKVLCVAQLQPSPLAEHSFHVTHVANSYRNQDIFHVVLARLCHGAVTKRLQLPPSSLLHLLPSAKLQCIFLHHTVPCSTALSPYTGCTSPKIKHHSDEQDWKNLPPLSASPTLTCCWYKP